MERPILSICIPCYNKAEYLERLITALEPLWDIAEICLFDNGSRDNPTGVLSGLETKLTVKILRIDVTGPIDFSWFSALAMGTASYKKLQLADDLPCAKNIRQGLELLIRSPGTSYILSSCHISFDSEVGDDKVTQRAAFDSSTALRRQIAELQTSRSRANFVFTNYAFGNNLSDINGVIFRSDALQSMSATSQNYYLCLTHPDAEIFLNLFASGPALFWQEPFSIYLSSPASPMNLNLHGSDFSQRVYVIPEMTHSLALLLDPGLRILRRDVDASIYWKFVYRFLKKIIRMSFHSRRREKLHERT